MAERYGEVVAVERVRRHRKTAQKQRGKTAILIVVDFV